MGKKVEDYILGLDLGTNSVGYAVLGMDYKVVRRSGKRFWGSILFDEGESAAATRTQRSARRRLERRKERIRLLRMLTENSVRAVDPAFFKRLDDSFLLNAEKDTEFGRDNLYNLFDGAYTDRDYYREYKTIYHLRRRLVEDPSQADIRLVYLALHHMIKYRGNFLHEEERMEVGGASVLSEVKDFFDSYGEFCLGEEDAPGFSDGIDCEKFAEILKSKARKKEKKEGLCALLSKGKNSKPAIALASLLLGYKADLANLFPCAKKGEEGEKNAVISFDGADYDEKAASFPDLFGDEAAELIEKLHRIYSDLVLAALLGEGKTYIYEGMIERFEKNAKDLAALKAVLRQDKAVYRAFFRADMTEGGKRNAGTSESGKSDVAESGAGSSQKGDGKKKDAVTFSAYFKSHIRGGKRVVGKTVKREDFYREVKSLLAKFPDSEEKRYCLDRIEEDDFLIRLNSVRNAAIPYQLSRNEMEKILDNQGKYYPELQENRDKIISLLTFKRPYSVGVLSQNSRFSWVTDGDVKAERAYPWNFEEVVNYDSVSEKFVKKLTGKCAVFKDQDVLPAMSVTYQAFNVLNELANVRLLFEDGTERSLSVEEKQKAFRLFLGQASVKAGDVAAMIRRETGRKCTGVAGLSDPAGKTFANKMSGYRALRAVLTPLDCFYEEEGELKTDEGVFSLYEQIAEILTVFSDREIRKRALKKVLPQVMWGKPLEALLKKNFTGWGKYSKKCLCEVYGAGGWNVLDAMYNSPGNFNHIVSAEDLGFQEQFSPQKEQSSGEIRYADVEELYLSPAVKRTVWQTIKAVREIACVMGCEPRCIYLESTRTDDKKVATRKRSDKIKELYDAVEKDVSAYNSDFFGAAADEARKVLGEDRLNDEKVYLYLLQMGKSMYSGKPLNINSLETDCEVDHIVPRHYIKDDSLQNKVLVLKNENQEKSGTLAIGKAVREKMTPFWDYLKKNGFLGNKKYNSLVKAEYTEADKIGFINRQLGETGQSLKAVRELLQNRYRESDVEFVKAGISSAFRSALTEQGYPEFFKLRDLNDFHHAKDAYLAAAIGYFTRKIYPVWGNDSEIRVLKEEMFLADADVRELCWKRNGLVVDMMQYLTPDVSDGVDWNVRYNHMLAAFSNDDCLVSRKKETQTGAFYKATVRSPREKKGNIPLRQVADRNGVLRPLPTEFYGNYEGDRDAYFLLATYEKGKRRETVLTGVPIRIAYLEKTRPGAVDEYLSRELGGQGKKLISYDRHKVLKYQLIRLNGQLCYVVAATEVRNAEQLRLDKKHALLLYAVEHPKKRINFGGKIYRLTDDAAFFTERMRKFIADYTEKLENRYANYKRYAAEIREYTASETFLSLPIYAETGASKADYITRLLNLTRACDTQLNMKDYGGKSGWGKLNGKTIRKDEVDWIDTSVTGIYRSEKKAKGEA